MAIKIVAFVLSFILNMAVIICGIVLSERGTGAGLQWGIILGIILVGFVIDSNYRPNRTHNSSREAAKRWKQRQEEMMKNPASFWRQMSRQINSLHFWFAGIVLTILGLQLWSTVRYTAFENFTVSAISLLSVYFCAEVFYFYLRTFLVKSQADEIVVDQEHFPQIYGIVSDIWKNSCLKEMPVILVEPEDDCRIGKEGKKHILYLGIESLWINTPEELKAMLYHEAAHVCNGDTNCSDSLGWITYMANLTAEATLMDHLFIRCLFGKVIRADRQFSDFMDQICLGKELLADQNVRNHHMEQAFINLVVKSWIYGLVRTYSRLEEQILEERGVPRNYYTRMYEDFRSLYIARKEFWNAKALSEIPIRFNTHPTVRERMARLEVPEYKIDFDNSVEREENPAYFEEIQMLIKICDERYKEAAGDGELEEIRNTEYIPFVKKAREADRLSPEELDCLMISELIDVAVAYRKSGEPAKCISICNLVRNKAPGNQMAQYLEGSLYLEELDARGVPFLLKVIKNENLFERVCNELMIYYLQAGDEKGLQELYDIMDDYEEEASREEEFDWKPLTAAAEDEQDIAYIKREQEIALIYAFISRNRDGSHTKMYCLGPSGTIKEPDWDEVMERVWWYLENEPGNYYLESLRGNKAMRKLTEEMPESLIYRRD